MRTVTRFAVLCCLLVLTVTVTYAQDIPQISILLPDYLADVATDDLLADFEDEHSVDVIVVEIEMMNIASPWGDPEAHLDDMAAFVSSADVLYMGQLTPMIIRAGYLLNLDPLLQVETEFAADFYPGLLESFQWDGGLWAIPFGWRPIAVNYDTLAFDEQGLSYPDETWTLEDYANSAEMLARFDENGEIVMPGIVQSGTDFLIRALYGQPYYDPQAEVFSPDYTTTELIALMTDWQALSRAEYMQSPDGGLSFGGDNPPPLIVSDFFFARNADTRIGLAPLPGGYVGARAETLAISSGTAYPELAFDLIAYLTRSPVFLDRFFGIPARQSTAEALQDTGMGMVFEMLTPQMQDLLAATQILPSREVLLGSDIWFELGFQSEETVDVEAALERAEAALQTRLDTAEERQETVIVVQPPPAPPELAPGEIALRFGVMGGAGFNPFQMQETLEQLAADFVAAHPTVGHIDLDLNPGGGPQSLAEEFDCFISSPDFGNSIDMMTDQLNSLDPLISADPDFDRDILAPGALTRVQVNGQTWALPLSIQPEVLFYDPQQFAAAGLPLPTTDWSVQTFEDALRGLQSLNPDEPVFNNNSDGVDQLLLLIHVYGGDPFGGEDGMNLTDPLTVEAVREVIGLVEAGLVGYEPPTTSGSRVFSSMSGMVPEGIARGSASNALTYTMDGDIRDLQVGLVNYPVAAGGPVVLNYQMQAAYISAIALDPEACYDWISTVSREPTLQQSLPANLSILDDPLFQAMLPVDLLVFYQDYAALMQAPNTILAASWQASNDILQFAVLNELTRAINQSLFDGADLLTALEDAETSVEEVRECVGEVDFATLDPDALTQAEIEQLQGCFARYLPTGE